MWWWKKTTVAALALGCILSFNGAFAQSYSPQNNVVYYRATPASASPSSILSRLMRANGLSSDDVQSIGVSSSFTLNAGTNGRQITFTRGLWNTLQSDDQRAFVIAHELSHIELNHIPKTQARQIGLNLVNQLIAYKTGNQGTLAGLLSQGGLSLIDKRFSRQAEYGADDLGLQMMVRAGYDPQAAIEVLTILEQSTASNSPEFMRDHPLNKARIAQLAEKYRLAYR